MNHHLPSTLAGDASQAIDRVVNELRNSLNGIAGGVELLKDTPLNPEQRRFVDLIETGSEALQALIQRLPEDLAASGEVATAASVLIAEASRINQMITVELLARLGLQSEAVGTAVDMLEQVRTGRFDTVMVDTRMPDIDFCRIAAEIRRVQSPGQSLRIIGVAAENRPGERERVLAAGMDAYLAKPLRLDDLRTVFLTGERPVVVNDAVDFDQLAVLKMESPGLLERLTVLFEESAQKAIAEMRLAASREERSVISAAAHMLKGSASNFGAHRMMAACQALEEGVVVAVKGVALQKLLDALDSEYHLVIKALQEYSRPSGAR